MKIRNKMVLFTVFAVAIPYLLGTVALITIAKKILLQFH